MTYQFIIAIPICIVAAMLGGSIIGACLENHIKWSE